jgi:hypothetical protein
VFDPSSKARLTMHDLGRFPGGSLFDRIGRAICRAECLPRKELFEAWEVARRVRRRFRGGRVLDLCAGHGLLGQIMLLLDDASPDVVLVDRDFPPSATAIEHVLAAEWPRLAGRVARLHGAVADAPVRADDVVVSVHACGGLTEQVLDRALGAGARVAVLPCCHVLDAADTGGLTGWLDGPLAVDVARAMRLRAHGWTVWTQTIPAAITPKNRLLVASPPATRQRTRTPEDTSD